jgi:hypothetical protein
VRQREAERGLALGELIDMRIAAGAAADTAAFADPSASQQGASTTSAHVGSEPAQVLDTPAEPACNSTATSITADSSDAVGVGASGTPAAGGTLAAAASTRPAGVGGGISHSTGTVDAVGGSGEADGAAEQQPPAAATQAAGAQASGVSAGGSGTEAAQQLTPAEKPRHELPALDTPKADPSEQHGSHMPDAG